MSDQLSIFGWWWLGSAIGGGVVLLLAGLCMRRTSSHTARQRLGEVGMAAAIAVALLRLGPTWLHIPLGQATPKCEPQVRVTFAERGTELAQAPSAELLASNIATDVRPIQAIAPESYADSVDCPICSNKSTSAAAPQWNWPIGWIDGVVALYGLVAVALLGRWLLGHWALHRIMSSARPAAPAVQQLFDRVAAESGQPSVPLLVSERIPVPLCCGLRRPAVVIPRSIALQNEPTILRWVFTHELTHLARRDPWSTWFMGLAQAVYFYLPWFWWVRRQVRLCQEYVADAAAAAQSRWADEYAEFLVSLARFHTAPVGATGVLGNTSDLYRRVSMVLKPTEVSKRHWSSTKLLTGATALMAGAVVFSGLGLSAAPPASCDPDEIFEVLVDPNGSDDKEIVVFVEDDEKKDGEKKDGEKKKEIRAKVIGAGGDMFKVDSGELEKKLRAALGKAKLDKEEIDKIVKEVLKQTQMRFDLKLEPLAKLENFTPMAPIVASGPIDLELKALAPLAQGGTVRWVGKTSGGRLGVTVDSPSAALADHLDLEKNQGLVIQSVSKDSAAEKAGFKANDILIRFNGKAVTSDSSDFIKQIGEIEAGVEFDAVVLRKGKKEKISGIKLPEKKKAEDMVKLWDATVQGKELKEKIAASENLAKERALQAEKIAKEAGARAEKFARDAEGRAQELEARAKEQAERALAQARDAEKRAQVQAERAEKALKDALERRKEDGDSGKKSEKKSNRSVSVSINDGEFSAKDTEDGLSISISGTVEDGKVKVSKVKITEGDSSNTYSSLDKVPSKHRARVEKLISNSGDSPVRFEFRKDKSDR